MSFTALAQQILRDAETLDKYIQANNLPKPSFDIDGPVRIPYASVEAVNAQNSLLATTHKLFHLTQGPVAQWFNNINGAAGDAMTTAAVYHFNLVDYVPTNGEAVPFEEVAQKAGMALRDFKMVARYAMTNFIFCEPRVGYIAHTSVSKALAENKLLRALMGMGANEIVPGLSKEIEVLEKMPGSEDPVQSGWALAYDARAPMFETLESQYPKRAETFAFAMEAMALMMPDSIVTNAYDWASLGSATLVDVGGGKGFACRALAKHFPKMSFIVQDLESTANAGRDQLPAELKDRIKFMTHDFFTPQPVKDADVYHFRAIFHDWPDGHCIRLLQNLIPALKKGAKVIIVDPRTPDPLKMQPWQERQSRASNIRMKVLFNSHDREDAEWPELFAKADPRFKVNSVRAVLREPFNEGGPTLAVVEAIWEG